MGGATRAATQQEKAQIASSYNGLLHRFSSSHLESVGNYSLSRMVGKGSFGKVYLATHTITGRKVVLKSTRKDDANLAREIHHHRQMTHPHIARLYEFIITESHVFLALEYCPGQELYDFLLRHRPLAVGQVRSIFAQICGAVAYVHSRNCVHRDLKLENILMDKRENVKLCDFGFTRETDGMKLMSTFCGTYAYAPPEMIKGEKYIGVSADVWSLGVILYALLLGELPFDEEDEADTKLKISNEDPRYPDTLPKDAQALLKLMLSKQKMARPFVAEVLAHAFVGEEGATQLQILDVAVPVPFTSHLEQHLLERMKYTGVNVDRLVESVLAQNCDALAGFWKLSLELEQRRDRKRQRRMERRKRSSFLASDGDSQSHRPSYSRRQSQKSHSESQSPNGIRDQSPIPLSNTHKAQFSSPKEPPEKLVKTTTMSSIFSAGKDGKKRPSNVLNVIRHWFTEHSMRSSSTKVASPKAVEDSMASSPGKRRPPPIQTSTQGPARSDPHGRTSPHPSTTTKQYSSRSRLGATSTSSSVSSMRSLHHKSHSKTSSNSSNSLTSIKTPRTPRSGVKVLAPTPLQASYPTHIHPTNYHHVYNEKAPSTLIYAKRRRTPFRGPSPRPKKEASTQSNQIRKEETVADISEGEEEE